MKPIQIDFKPSITLTLIICTMGLGATAILILPTLIWQLKLLLGIAIFTTVTYYICHHCLLLLPWSCISLNVNSNHQVQVSQRNGKVVSVDICPDSVVTPYLTIINCKVQEAKFFTLHLVILPDMIDAEFYRQLRVWLRWGKPTHT